MTFLNLIIPHPDNPQTVLVIINVVNNITMIWAQDNSNADNISG